MTDVSVRAIIFSLRERHGLRAVVAQTGGGTLTLGIAPLNRAETEFVLVGGPIERDYCDQVGPSTLVADPASFAVTRDSDDDEILASFHASADEVAIADGIAAAYARNISGD